jgi:hypothetical protein
MKSNLTLLLFFCLPFWAFGQYEWAPFGAVWHVNEAWFFDPIDNPLFDYYTVEVTGDTMIGGMAGRKVGDYITVQSGNRVYLWWQDSLNLIYDYDLTIGDTVTFSLLSCDNQTYAEAFTVDEIDTLFVDNMPLRRFFTSSIYGPNQEYYYEYAYIEKIGTPDLPISNHAYCFFTADHVPAWTRCYRDAEIFYRSERFNQLAPDKACDVISSLGKIDYATFTVYPNPANGFTRIELGALSDVSGSLRVEVIHPTGQLVITEKIPDMAIQFDLNLAQIASGHYLIKILKEDGQLVGMNKLVVVK